VPKAISVKDNGTIIQISYDDILKYHGRSFIAGAALAYKMMEMVFDIIPAPEVLSREQIEFCIGVNGPGIIDAIEMVTRAKTQGRLTVDQNIAKWVDAPEAADGHGGKYYFEVICRGEKFCLTLKQGIIPEEFIAIANKTHDGSITTREADRLKELKEEIAEFVMNATPSSLFHVCRR